MFSFLAKQRNRTHRPCSVPERSWSRGDPPDKPRRSIPWLIDSVHVMDPDVDEVVEGGVIQRHVVSTTIKLVLVEGHQASMVN